ncbi:MAG: CBS domain-containing protein [Haliangium ochraceum]
MDCREIMNTNLEWLTEQSTVLQAAIRMADAGVGFLPICDYEGRAIGVVTDRDLATRALAQSVGADQARVTNFMSAPVFTCLADAPIAVAEDVMVKERKQRLVCTDLDGRAVGVLSIVDLLEHAPAGDAIATARAVMQRESLGPRGGAAAGATLLKDVPGARTQPAEAERHAQAQVHDTVAKGGNWGGSMKEFP